MPRTHTCPSCNGSLPDARPGSVVSCAYCGNQVVLPRDGAPAHPAGAISFGEGPSPAFGGPPVPQQSSGRGCAAVVALVVLLVVGGLGAFFAFQTQEATPPTVPVTAEFDQDEESVVVDGGPLTTIGGEGTDVGPLDDARDLGVDAEGLLYVGEFSTGLVRRFTPAGADAGQFAVTEPDRVLQQLSVDAAGTVYVTQGFDIHTYSPAGQRGPDVAYPTDEAIVVLEGVAPLPDGGLLVNEDGTAFVWLDPTGAFVRRADPPQLDVGSSVDRIAVGPDGTIYGVGTRAQGGSLDNGVYVFDPEGTFVRFIGGDGRDLGITGLAHLAVDSRSRVAVTTFDGVLILTAEGRLLGTLPVRTAFGLAFDADDRLWISARDHLELWQVPE